MALKEEFKEQIEELKIFIFNRIKPLKLNETSIHGTDFVVLTQSYISAINAGGVPIINDAWTEVIETQMKSAYEKALRHYSRDLKQYLS